MNIGSAPVSFGIHGAMDLSLFTLTPDDLLAAIAAAGYRGSELGPPGFFGTPEQTARAFATHGLTVIGGYVPLHLSESDEVMRADLEGMRRTLDELGAAGGSPLAVLADEGDPGLLERPFRPGAERGLSPQQWDVAIERLNEVNDIATAAGVRTSFHPHFGTYVEQASEIDTLLERTAIDLCLDTGHFLLGDADPLRYLTQWGSRVNHIHIKDVRLSVRDEAQQRGATLFDGWWEDVSMPLGGGDGALDEFLAEVGRTGFDGWIVVEQDGEPATAENWDAIVRDQRHNHDWVAERAAR